MKRSPVNHQLALPPQEVPMREQRSAVFPNQEQPQPSVTKQESLTDEAADALSVAVVDEAIERSGLTNGEVAFVLKVSESMVRKMRNPSERARMSQAQFIRLAFFRPSFFIAYQRAIEARTGWMSRHALEAQREATAFFAVVVK